MKQTIKKWSFNFKENQLETKDGKVITVIGEHRGSLKDIDLIVSAPEMLEMLHKCYTGEIEEPYNNDELADLINRADLPFLFKGGE